jgi:hypothetical protein
VESWQSVATVIAEPGLRPIANTYPDDAHGAFHLVAPPDAARMLDVELEAGRWLRPNDTRAVVINQMVPGYDRLRIGDTLTFSVTNLPAWATFNASTGRLTGTPSAADVATYSNIRISVSDGQASASLNAFAITVADTVVGSATLSWTPPTENSDGSSLTNLAGYRVHYGRSPTQLSQTVEITNSSLSTYVVENLSSGTWYFAVMTVNTGGTTSVLSNVAAKTIS